jgi:hypothetical protein
MPDHLVRFDRQDDVFQDAGALIVSELGAEVLRSRGVGDFEDQLGKPADESSDVPRLSAVFGQDAEQAIGWGSLLRSTITEALSRTSTPGVFSA